jgi:hypothetical protein
MANQAAIDAPTGFQPWESVIQAHLYSVVTSCATAFFVGDLVKHAGASLLTPVHGYLMQVQQHAAGAAGLGLGAVLACFDHNYKPTGYIASGAVGNGTIAGYVLVSDSPHQLYIAQEDGDTGSMTVGDIGLNADAINTASGNVNTYISGMEIDSNTSASTATLALHIVGLHPEDTAASASTTTGNHARYIVQLNTHSLGNNEKGQS